MDCEIPDQLTDKEIEWIVKYQTNLSRVDCEIPDQLTDREVEWIVKYLTNFHDGQACKPTCYAHALHNRGHRL